MNPFDITQSPLRGVHLIEAGAGTGKTYTIAGLFLRLVVERGLAVDQILVVTYTKAATEELKTRIRGRLLAARACIAGGGHDPLLQWILRSGVDPRQALQRVQDALTDFDRAAIFTIHGFCQRVLHRFAFETGHLFQAELLPEVQPLIQEAADDFWRRHVSLAPAELVRFVLDHAAGPEELAELCRTCRFPRAQVLPPARKIPLLAIGEWRRLAARLHALWPRVREEVCDLLLSEGLNAGQYGRCEPDPEVPQGSRRRAAVAGLQAAMDQWAGGYPIFERFERFCQSCIAKATKKKHPVPAHPFFALCDRVSECRKQMERQLAEYWRYLKVRWLADCERRLSEKKARENLLFFDDLLSQLHAALQDERSGELVAAIQKHYPAALVDEFQDTDAFQYEIFTRLFSGGRSLLFMIGDPKQAIYGFRGADLFSYLHAKRESAHRYTLTRNWRASPELITALNALFGRCAHPFGYAEIPYEKAVPAPGAAPSPGAPFKLWLVTRGADQDETKPLTQQEALPRIVRAVADAIVALLADGRAPAAPEQIAVLTRTHHQAQRMKDALAAAHVPAVLHSTGSVFASDEAGELALVLRAAAQPADARRLRAALATDLIGAGARELCASMEESDGVWQARFALFARYHETFVRHGFYRMFNQLMAQEKVRSRMLRRPDGERRLTNLLHLAELVHQADATRRLGPEGVLKWLERQRAGGAAASADEQKLRLESDARAVRIITIHKSKGLQFDIVFCPFLWAAAKVDDHAVTFHDPDQDDRPTVVIGPGIAARDRELALQEALAENLRLMYVGLTRARRSCTMVWGAIKGSEISAPAYLLHGSPGLGATRAGLEDLKARMSTLTDAQMMADLQRLAQTSAGTVRVAALPAPVAARYRDAPGEGGQLHCRRFARPVDSSWRVASFTSLAARLSESERPDHDAGADVPETAAGPGGADDLFGFPKGSGAGIFFHHLLERWEQIGAGTEEAQRRQWISGRLQAHGFSPDYTDMVESFLARLWRNRLPDGGGGSFTLSEIDPRKRIHEMEFYFPLRKINADQLKSIFSGPGAGRAGAGEVERLSFAPLHGFMKGFVDMLFEHGGRYYLLDWKSNHLGHAWDDYAPDRLARVMDESLYFLQSHLYALALDLLLRRSLPEYAYETHFGGVYYLFLRGIQGGGSSCGLHFALPPKAVMQALRETLVESPAQTAGPAGQPPRPTG